MPQFDNAKEPHLGNAFIALCNAIEADFYKLKGDFSLQFYPKDDRPLDDIDNAVDLLIEALTDNHDNYSVGDAINFFARNLGVYPPFLWNIARQLCKLTPEQTKQLHKEVGTTLVYAMSDEQARVLVKQLQNSLDAGGKTVLLMTISSELQAKEFERRFSSPDFDVRGLPAPDYVSINTIYTVSLREPLEQFAGFLEQYMRKS